MEEMPVKEALCQLLHSFSAALYKLGIKLSPLLNAGSIHPFQQPLSLRSLELSYALLSRFRIALLPSRLRVQIHNEATSFTGIVRGFCWLSNSPLLEKIISELFKDLWLLCFVIVLVWSLEDLLFG